MNDLPNFHHSDLPRTPDFMPSSVDQPYVREGTAPDSPEPVPAEAGYIREPRPPLEAIGRAAIETPSLRSRERTATANYAYTPPAGTETRVHAVSEENNPAPGQQVEVIAKGDAYANKSGVGHTTKVYVATTSGELLARANAGMYAYGRPVETGVITEQAVQTRLPPLSKDQRMPDSFPDELVIDVLPENHKQQTAAVKALLHGYTDDMRSRMTDPIPGSPHQVAYKPDAVAMGYVDEPVDKKVFDDDLVGGPGGLNRLVLQDAESVKAGMQGSTEAPTTEAALAALRSVQCVPLGISVDPQREHAIQIEFGRENPTIVEGQAVEASPAGPVIDGNVN
jgi:hypothetical protein